MTSLQELVSGRILEALGNRVVDVSWLLVAGDATHPVYSLKVYGIGFQSISILVVTEDNVKLRQDKTGDATWYIRDGGYPFNLSLRDKRKLLEHHEFVLVMYGWASLGREVAVESTGEVRCYKYRRFIETNRVENHDTIKTLYKEIPRYSLFSPMNIRRAWKGESIIWHQSYSEGEEGEGKEGKESL